MTTPAAPETFLDNVLGYYRADHKSGSNLADFSPNARTLTNTSGAYVTTSTANGWPLNSVAAAQFNTSAYFTAGVSTPYKPLHDGSGGAFFCIFTAYPTTNAQETLFDTGAFDHTKDGVVVYYDATNECIDVEFSRSYGSGQVVDYFLGNRKTWPGSVKVGKAHALLVNIQTAKSPHIEIWLDGKLIDAFDVDVLQRTSDGASLYGTAASWPEPRTFGVANPGYNLRVGSQANSPSNGFYGEMGEFGFLSKVPSGAKREMLWQWAEYKYGFSFDRSKLGLILFDGDSLTDIDWRADQWPIQATPHLGVSALYLRRAIAGMEMNQIASRFDRHVAPYYDPERPFNVYVLWPDYHNELVNGFNGGGSNRRSTKETTFAQAVEVARRAKRIGFTVVVADCLAGTNVAQVDSDGINTAMAARWKGIADAYVALSADPDIGSYANWTSDYNGGAGPCLYWNHDLGGTPDGVHQTSLGGQIIAALMATVIKSILPPS